MESELLGEEKGEREKRGMKRRKKERKDGASGLDLETDSLYCVPLLVPLVS